jgi:short-subunit dehydrogenase
VKTRGKLTSKATGMKLLLPILGAGAALLARRIFWPPHDLRGRVVLIKGGSRGLGFALARAFSRKGCPVVLCARDAEQLARASRQLEAEGAQVLTIPCDVSDRKQVSGMMQQIMQTMGRVDILVNNAGVIQVGPARQMQIEDFEQALNVNFWGTLHPILELLPHMTQNGGGTIVNITSIGGKVSVPHLLPYSCAKFAAVALSEGLRAELAADGIAVLTVVPGLMRTGSHINAFFKGQAELEYTWFAASASLPVASISPERAARSVVRAVQNRRSEVVLSLPAKVMAHANGLCPELTQQALDLAARMLPGPSDSDGASHRGSDFASHNEGNRLRRFVNRAGKRSVDRYQWGRNR